MIQITMIYCLLFSYIMCWLLSYDGKSIHRLCVCYYQKVLIFAGINFRGKLDEYFFSRIILFFSILAHFRNLKIQVIFLELPKNRAKISAFKVNYFFLFFGYCWDFLIWLYTLLCICTCKRSHRTSFLKSNLTVCIWCVIKDNFSTWYYCTCRRNPNQTQLFSKPSRLSTFSFSGV